MFGKFLLGWKYFFIGLAAAACVLGVTACGAEEKVADAAPKAEIVSEKTPVGEAVAVRDSDVKMVPAEGVSVLMYHMIGDIPDNGAVLTEENFRAHLELIRKNGFHPISMTELYAYVTEGAPLPEKPLCITFDDGYADNFSIVYPLMKEYGYPWTVFVITGDVGKPGRMTWDELREMAESRAVTIASHTATHPKLAEIPAEAARADIAAAQRALKEKLGIENRWLAFPYGSYDAEVIDIAKSLGIQMVVTSDSGRVHTGDDPYTLRRAWIGNEVSEENYRERLTRDDYTPVG